VVGTPQLRCQSGCTLKLKLWIGKKSTVLPAVGVDPSADAKIALSISSRMQKTTRRALRKRRRTRIKLVVQPRSGAMLGKAQAICLK
jgi:hypothetical protein